MEVTRFHNCGGGMGDPQFLVRITSECLRVGGKSSKPKVYELGIVIVCFVYFF